ncbi:hypothetical protein IMZ48_26515 [Candidatus Bathyarchaeota archaeon]|nr:hypothetical protein [Candidatus Bathyarchaeota archaeon]
MGRVQIYLTNADRQRAYRLRRRTGNARPSFADTWQGRHAERFAADHPFLPPPSHNRPHRT